ncbi:CRP/FNR family transcriptional regulator, anaerobic regulatory protein [Lebetimonas natsushimae]|uniref:CRP/FNR family transcriptional regulator, anaerobic regulatory protein n=1 Tax=Lebetimonas natsushimae TaxID=1936991 RepID=A0A292YHT2_9BACT|nr:Crp/Fnr family transcriptional regulator [Lebetimonas natsushimae]GAX88204.1 CRP/FNR family transcriptional regulator, anaerobic regulatory protein [Lebetimonas natsushimae]
MNFKDIFLFKNLEDKDINEIKKFSIVKKLKKNDIVFYEKEEPNYLHLLVEGTAKVYKVDNRGNELIIHKFYPPSLIAELASFEKIPYPANCAMESDGIVIKIEFEKFKKFLKKGDVCLSVMSSLLKKMKYLDGIIQDNLILDTTTKIAKFIYDNPEAFEDLKQHSIAAILNIKPETLSRKLKILKDLGIIEKKDNKFTVKNREKIKEHFNW